MTYHMTYLALLFVFVLGSLLFMAGARRIAYAPRLGNLDRVVLIVGWMFAAYFSACFLLALGAVAAKLMGRLTGALL